MRDHRLSSAQIIVGDCRDVLAKMESEPVRCIITSPPYFGLRDYEHGDQIGLESAPDEYVAELVAVFHEARRVLADDGTLWLNLGDSYVTAPKGSGGVSGLGGRPNLPSVRRNAPELKQKDLIGAPWRVALALQTDGWYLRSDIIWAKPNPLPESVTDRCTKSHEYLFLLSKSARYFYDAKAISEDAVTGSNGSEFDTGKTGEHQLGRAQKRHDPGQERTAWAAPGQTAQMTKRARSRFGDSKPDNEYESAGRRNKRDVWTIPTRSFTGAHFAVMPTALVEPCVLAGSQEGDLVLDPFAGSGTVGVVALRHQRNFVGIELNPEYAKMAVERIKDDAPLLNAVTVLRPKEQRQEVGAFKAPTDFRLDT